MKMKSMFIVSAVSAVALWSTGAYAAPLSTGDDFAVGAVRRWVLPAKSVELKGGVPLMPGDKVYFDVELALDANIDTNHLYQQTQYVTADEGDRPRLVLNMAMQGDSTIASDAEGYKKDVDTPISTDTAVAYWCGSEKLPSSKDPTKESLWNRFVYTVRPGDIIDDIDVMYNGNALVVEGLVGNLYAQVKSGTASMYSSIEMSANSFNFAPGVTLGANDTITTNRNEGEPSKYAVAGYAITVGDVGNGNEGSFYKGLVPVTVTLPVEDVAPSKFKTSVKYSFWLEAVNENGEVEYIPAKVTSYTNDTLAVAGADSDDTKALTAYNKAWAATSFVAPKVANISQRFFVSVPHGVTFADGTAVSTVRLCYGVEQTHASYNNYYGYTEVDLLDSPIFENGVYNDSLSGYSVGVTNASSTTSVEILSKDVASTFVGTGSDDVVASGETWKLNGSNVAFVSAPAGATINVTITKDMLANLASYGRLYAYIEQVTTTNAGVAPSTYVVPLEYDGANLFALDFKVANNATEKTAVYRVRIPGLGTSTVDGVKKENDEPFYIVMEAAPRQEEIAITMDESGGSITEHYTPAEVPVNGGTVNATITKFTATYLTPAANNATRYFLVHPVFSDGKTEITEDYYFKDRYADAPVLDANNNNPVYAPESRLSVLSVLRKMAQVQTSPNGIATVVGDPLRLRLSVSATTTSSNFYVVALNNYPSEILNSTIVKKVLVVDGNGDPVLDNDNNLTYKYEEVELTVPGPLFAVRACNTANVVTGTADICDPVASVAVSNRAPEVKSYSVPGGTTLGATVPFTFNLVDVKSDFLVAEMIFDTADAAARDFRLIANEKEMIALMGHAAWMAKIAELEKKYEVYGVETGDFADGGDKRLDRTGTETSVSFSYAYQNEGDKNWEFVAYDSSNAYVTVRPTGTIEITSAQKFTFNVFNQASAPGLGYVVWAADGDTPVAQEKWEFNLTTTTAALSRNSGTIASVLAVPFPANGENASDTFDKLRDPSETLDSFFYKWAASNEYAALLPDGTDPAQTVYSPVLHITRAFTVGGGAGGGADTNDSETWSDVILSAIFAAERYPGDALMAYDLIEAPRANIWSFGDYNQDNIPDGWLVNSYGADAYAMIEGTSVATNSNEGDNLPLAGWGAADAAYRNPFIENSQAGTEEEPAQHIVNTWDRANPHGPIELIGNPFTYQLRVRGQDIALNAANGEGEWLSAPAWRVMLRPTQVVDNEGKEERYVNVGTVNANGVYTPSEYVAHDLYMGTWETRTKRHKIPYGAEATIPTDISTELGKGWHYVIDANGEPLNKDGHHVVVNTLEEINTNVPNPNYEEILDLYDCGWGYFDEGAEEPGFVVRGAAGAAGAAGVVFPFADTAAMEAAITAAKVGGQFRVTSLGGAVPTQKTPQNETLGSEYCFSDWRVPAGILIDEAFSGNDPRNTSWLDRYAGATADSNANNVNNGAEYYFWYYASRMAFASVYQLGNNVQVNTCLWPAIDIIHNSDEYATDERYGTTNRFVMGRAYNNDYDPDLVDEDLEVDDPEAVGNYWTYIAVEDIIDLFAPASEDSARLAESDPDNDGLSTGEEITLGTNPLDCDTDNDWIIDGWEDAWNVPETINPLNPDDADENPDGDFYVEAEVWTFPERHDLYKLDATVLPVGASHAFYDIVDKCVRYTITEDDEFSLATTPIFSTKHLLDEVLVWEEATEAEKANFTGVQMDVMHQYAKSEQKKIRHKEVYETFGFSPYEGYLNGAAGEQYTEDFTTRDEFEMWVRLKEKANVFDVIGRSVDPTKVDTNDDGIPDGWSLYVGLDAVNRPQDGDANALDNDGLSALEEYQHGADFANKPYPTDPRNGDTDFDGIWDANEIEAGLNPTSLDTDGDFISDTYEYVWNKENDENVGISATNPDDFDLDPDGDGLSNYHEYMTGLFRHFRYDLSPAASRIYKGTKGELAKTRGIWRWSTYPDLYNIYEDMMNPDVMVSMDYLLEASDPALPKTLDVHTIKPFIAKMDNGDAGVNAAAMALWSRSIVVPTKEQLEVRSEAIANLDEVNGDDDLVRIKQSIEAIRAFLAAADRATLTMGEDVYSSSEETMNRAWFAISRIDAIFADWEGLKSELANQTGANEVALTKSIDEGKKIWKVRREQLIKAALWDQDAEEPDAEDWIDLDEHIEKYYEDFEAFVAGFTPEEGTDPEVTVPLLANKDNCDAFLKLECIPDMVMDTDVKLAMVYESLFNGAGLGADDLKSKDTQDTQDTQICDLVECPLLQAQYRMAMRGFNGGIWRGATEAGGAEAMYFVPITYTMPVKSLFDRDGVANEEEENETVETVYVFGLQPESALNAALPNVNDPRWARPLFSTSPILADSDGDGMDDYWEIFHGLNPMLGDYINDRREEDVLEGNHSADILASIYEPRADKADPKLTAAYYTFTPEENAFGNLLRDEEKVVDKDPFKFKAGVVTGFDYYTMPWMTGVPFADADGDGLLNYREAVNPEDSATLYGTDPSPLWMTDPDNENSFVSRFYTLRNMAEVTDIKGVDPSETITQVYPTFTHPGIAGYTVNPDDFFPIFPFEVNEGFDTDGDGLSDMTEVTSANGNNHGDPQSAASPLRNFAAYFGGEVTETDAEGNTTVVGGGAMQTAALIEFGPTALTTFTVECWVCPDPTAKDGEMVLVDRPWSASDRAASADLLRHNFVLGLERKGGKTYPYAFYTGAGTVEEGTANATVPTKSPRVQATMPLETMDETGAVTNQGAWSHIAVSYDGTSLKLYVNGTEAAARTTTLIPANGVLSFVNSEAEEAPPLTYTYRMAPILLGATPTLNWFAEMKDILTTAKDDGVTNNNESDYEPEAWGDVYTKCYKGYMDEVRIWDRARTAEEIAANYQKTLSVNDLIGLRFNAMMDRLGYDGVYEDDVRAYPVAIYTFDDMLSTTKVDPDALHETYIGEKLVGGEDVPGSFLYRKMVETAVLNPDTNKTVTEKKGADAAGPLEKRALQRIKAGATFWPETSEVFKSYYDVQTPDFLKSTMYGHFIEIGNNTEIRNYEYVPKALNMMSHLPRFNVDLAAAGQLGQRRDHLYANISAEQRKLPILTRNPIIGDYMMLDTFFWRNGYAGKNEDATIQLKANWNPYGYRYLTTPEFNQDTHAVNVGYMMIRSTDLMVYGNAYARYSNTSWSTDYPISDPSTGETLDRVDALEGTPGWFEHYYDDDEGSADTGDNLNDKQYSAGEYLLESEVAMGQTNDRDEDRLPDWWEKLYTLDPEDPTSDDGAFGDPDGDFLTNYAEFLAPSNPKLYSTAGNGIPDFHVPLYYRRGAPIMGMLYSDGDFIEDHWEHALAANSPSVDHFDAYADPDNDGWSNYAEARVNARGVHSTDPNAKDSQDLAGQIPAYPTPALLIKVDYFGDTSALLPEENEDVEGEAEEVTRNIVVHTFTAAGNQSAPDAVFTLPLSETDEGEEEAAERSQIIGRMNYGTTKGYLEPGNIKAGSVSIITTYYQEIGEDGTLNGYTEGAGTTIRDDGKGNLVGFFSRTEIVPPAEEGGEPTERVVWTEHAIGTIDYTTGAYAYTISPEQYAGALLNDQGEIVALLEDVSLKASYSTVAVKTLPASFTFSQPTKGHIKEGVNNFFVFVDLNGNGLWNAGEPAGVPDQHDVEIGYDTINRQLHVTLTELAPPGSVRVDIQSILDTFKEEKLAAEEEFNNAADDEGGDGEGNEDDPEIDMTSVIRNPLTENPIRWDFIVGKVNEQVPDDYVVVLFFWKADEENGTMNGISYQQKLNTSKPYLTEDEIFSANPAGLDADPENAPGIAAMKYLVCLIPEDDFSNPELTNEAMVQTYAVATAINNCGTYDLSLTKLSDPEEGNLTGGKIVNNSNLSISWECTTQVPTFDLEIVKTHDAAGQALSSEAKILTQKGIRGVSACATVTNALSTNTTPVYKYTYEVPNIIGELNADATALCGNGAYRYTVTLRPFSGEAAVLTGTFAVQLNDSRDIVKDENGNVSLGTVETYWNGEAYVPGVLDTSFNAYNSYYVRANVRYNGVLKRSEDFGVNARFRIEAHHSASFNGVPVASTSDCLKYDSEDMDNANLNHCVIMEKTDLYTQEGEDLFYSTRFRTEIRGLPSNEPVYLMAYLDLNNNGKRDTWEPWGYLTKGRNNEVQGMYYDPVTVTPTGSSQAVAAEFYIQDVDTDNDKLADAWEWKTCGQRQDAFSEWCNNYSGYTTTKDGTAFTTAGILWTENTEGVLSLTTFGAQVYGVNVLSVADANGAVKTDIDEGLASVSIFSDILEGNEQLALSLAGYTAYELAIDSIAFDGEDVKITWGIDAENKAGEVVDVTALIADKSVNAKYVVYGTDTIGGEWSVVAEGVFEVGATGANIDLTQIDGAPAFFKVAIGVAE